MKKPDKCCALGSYECQVPMPLNGRLQSIDFCIADIVAALNAANITTGASCCGHGESPPEISLTDGSTLKIYGGRFFKFLKCKKITPPSPPAYAPFILTDGARLIAQERIRQITEEGLCSQNDDAHRPGKLATAGACYASNAAASLLNSGAGPTTPYVINPSEAWPFGSSWWKPSPDPVRDLTKAGALIAAEIDRILRARDRPSLRVTHHGRRLGPTIYTAS